MTLQTPSDDSTVLGIASLNRLVRDCLESTFPLLWVGGEISNLTYAASGHVYFSLKDATAQVRCVMWRSRAQTLGWRLENGQKIEARVLVSFYEPRGEFQLSIEAIRRSGQGELFERFLRLKAQLEAEGLFAPDTKRPRPPFPQRIAIVSSPQAAALRDVLTTLHRRAPHIGITLFPTPVQGEAAGPRIAEAIDAASASDADLILLCRGGGSIEDLWAFNEALVARAIRAARIPVITGIGHETDFTIADFAADLRAPTPTAAAELASPERDALLRHLDQRAARLRERLVRNLSEHAQRLDGLAARLTHPSERLRRQQTDVAQLATRLRRDLRHQLTQATLKLSGLAQRLNSLKPQFGPERDALCHLVSRLHRQTCWQLAERNTKLNALGRSLSQLDPHAVLTRGYALALDIDGRAVRDASELTPGDRLQLGFARGHAAVTVDRVVPNRGAD